MLLFSKQILYMEAEYIICWEWDVMILEPKTQNKKLQCNQDKQDHAPSWVF